ncbi:hypothetical protein ABTL76_20185, partial [Acinetobacter baumannii]
EGAPGRIVLLDFGAARAVPERVATGYRALLAAGLAGDQAGVRAAIRSAGFASDLQFERHGPALDAMIGVILRQVER